MGPEAYQAPCTHSERGMLTASMVCGGPTTGPGESRLVKGSLGQGRPVLPREMQQTDRRASAAHVPCGKNHSPETGISESLQWS